MFYARREPFKTNLGQAPDEPKNLPASFFESGKRPGSARPNKVARVTRSWHSLLENYSRLIGSRGRLFQSL